MAAAAVAVEADRTPRLHHVRHLQRHFKLNEDGSIKKVKARFVACGYSQIADIVIDFCKTYAHTLPGGCFPEPENSPGKSKAQRAKFDSMTVGDKATAVDAAGYLTKLGEVAWPTNMTWPELAYYVSFLGQFNNSPQAEHHAALDHVLGYLLNDPDMGITYGGKLRVPLGLVDFPPYFIESKGLYGVGDSSWGTRPKPYGGHCVMRTNGAIHWRARALKVITDSTAHAETAEQSSLTKSSTYFRMVLSGIKRAVTGPTAQLTDNSASFDLVSKEGTSSKSRHFERAIILVKYAIMRLLVSCYLVSTKFMVADIFTKATDETTFQTMRGILRNTKSPQLGMRGARIWRKVFGW